ncbi:MAG: tRNA(Ile)(2)-agmatinylcytidine synthase [Sulfolobales archaeon]|nr:tRNA(Ile)(2)-agmatinylcytidine synthase [Sulfolobales archaeon]MCX8209294.1 tRNA(Ile)(2)-agmatinylcytidine synthase [Sulfolobales archaeon]MDW8011034.1 tRNA(Ile)(2)-agmatinylcytidine synthase [Sulfolobales archaeon]
MRISIGVDSVDSQYGGCTTHALYRLFKNLLEKNYVEAVLDYPHLVRLNPSIPRKTRGNGAVAIDLEIRSGVTVELVATEVAEALERYLDETGGNPSRACAAVVLHGDAGRFRELYFRALTDFVHLDYVAKLVGVCGGSVLLPLGFNEGCVGALAAVGWDRSRCTYELLLYRKNRLTPERILHLGRLAEIDRSPEYETFCSYDYESGRAISVPRGPDPVLVGIRGLNPDKLTQIARSAKIAEDVEGWFLFKTNQAVGAHLVPRASADLKPFRTGCVLGVVTRVSTRPGGDVLLEVSDGYGSLGVAVFRETGLTRYVRNLVVGDVVRVCGSTKLWSDSNYVLHAELVEVVELAEVYVKHNPRCPNCGARVKSAGRGKGFKCVKCGFRSRNLPYELSRKPREIDVGTYLPSCGSAKHLSIPSPLLKVEVGSCERRPSSLTDFYS